MFNNFIFLNYRCFMYCLLSKKVYNIFILKNEIMILTNINEYNHIRRNEYGRIALQPIAWRLCYDSQS